MNDLEEYEKQFYDIALDIFLYEKHNKKDYEIANTISKHIPYAGYTEIKHYQE